MRTSREELVNATVKLCNEYLKGYFEGFITKTELQKIFKLSETQEGRYEAIDYLERLQGHHP